MAALVLAPRYYYGIYDRRMDGKRWMTSGGRARVSGLKTQNPFYCRVVFYFVFYLAVQLALLLYMTCTSTRYCCSTAVSIVDLCDTRQADDQPHTLG